MSAGTHTRLEVIHGEQLWRTLLRVARASHHHRTTGHAAEMAFFAVLTLVPSTIAVGSALGLSKSVLGDSVAVEAENAAVGAVRTLMGPELADSVIAPFVHAQLSQASGGVAIGGLIVAWWLSSHLFEATGHALDSAYGVADARKSIVTRLLALGFALVSVVLVAVTVEMMVVGPLGHADAGLPLWLGLGEAYTIVWSIVRGAGPGRGAAGSRGRAQPRGRSPRLTPTLWRSPPWALARSWPTFLDVRAVAARYRLEP